MSYGARYREQRFLNSKPTRREVKNAYDVLDQRVQQIDLILTYVAEKAGVELKPELFQEWMAERAKKAAEAAKTPPASPEAVPQAEATAPAAEVPNEVPAADVQPASDNQADVAN